MKTSKNSKHRKEEFLKFSTDVVYFPLINVLTPLAHPAPITKDATHTIATGG